MRYSTAYTRCDLCGRFANKCVTEKSPPHKVEETKVCVDCIVEAIKVIAQAAPGGEPGDTLTDGEVSS